MKFLWRRSPFPVFGAILIAAHFLEAVFWFPEPETSDDAAAVLDDPSSEEHWIDETHNYGLDA